MTTPPDSTNTVYVTAAQTVSVELEAKPYHTLTTSVTGGIGTIDPDNGQYHDGTVVTITVIPASGNRLKAWHGTDNDLWTLTTNTVTLDIDRTVTAELEAVPDPTISGSVIDWNTFAGLPDVEITFAGVGSAVTGPDGPYSKVVPYGWSGRAQPVVVAPITAFTPEYLDFPETTMDWSGVVYYATVEP